MTKHTPGPWKIDDSWYDYTVVGPNGEEIIFQDGPHGTPTLKQVDARLIAAAPDMLEALERVLENSMDPKSVEEFGGYCLDSETSEIARSAIAKAKGETHE